MKGYFCALFTHDLDQYLDALNIKRRNFICNAKTFILYRSDDLRHVERKVSRVSPCSRPKCTLRVLALE